MEKIIQFFGTENLTITSQLTKALQRYCNFCNGIDGGWKIVGTNICDNNLGNEESSLVNITQTPIISIPLFLRNPDNNLSDDPFHSFDKIGIFDDNLKSIGFNKFLQSANSIIEKIETVKSIEQEIKNEVGYSIQVLNIQSGDLKFWEIQLNEILGKKSNNNTFYIFYWQLKETDRLQDSLSSTYLKKKRNEYEIKDKIWGYSKFLRDFLNIRNRCYILEINEFQQLASTGIRNLIIEKTSKSEPIDGLHQFFLKAINNLLELYPFTKSLAKSFDVKDIARLHLFNRSNHFQDNYFEKKFQNLVLSSIGSSHGLLKQKDTIILDYDHVNHLGLLENKLFFYDLFKNVTDACVYYIAGNIDNKPEFLFLDDVPTEKIKTEEYSSYYNKIKCFKDWFPESRFFYSQDKELFHKQKLFSGKDEDFVMGEFVFDNDDSSTNRIKDRSFNITKNKGPLFIGIDIDWSGEQFGFELLKQFRKNNHRVKRKCFVFVFSRFEYPDTIRKAVASGALFYFTKQNFMTLVPKVYGVLRYLGKENPLSPNYSKYENWHLMKKLEPSKIVELQTSIIKGFDYWKDNQKKESLTFTADYKWIQKLPKADLHCHIGSCLGPDLLPITALMVLSEKFEKGKIKTDSLENIIRFLRIFVNGLSMNGDEVQFIIPKLFKALDLGTKAKGAKFCLFKAFEDKHGLNLNLIFPEELFLSPENFKFDRLIHLENFNHEYFKLRRDLRERKISYDDLMLFFILFIFVREENISENNFKKELNKKVISELNRIIKLYSNQGSSINKVLKTFSKNIDPSVDTPNVSSFLDILSETIKKIKNDLIQNDPREVVFAHSGNRGFLKRLQSASGKASSLFSYLRGCEYGGSPHLQTRLSIYLATFYIVHHYAIPDNIRYLALRCAVNGYSKSGILNQHEAMQALLRGFNFSMKRAQEQNNNVHVNLILTAKRHKAEKEFGENVALALQYRNGISIGKKTSEKCLYSFFGTDSKVVSFDLAGLEKGNRPSKFVQHFMPLLKQCFPITIHAGEEDDHEAIWEAIYLVHSQRIGHGLTLRNNRELLLTAKERHIAIELCPISNLLTREQNSSKSIYDSSFCKDAGCDNRTSEDCSERECLEEKFAQSDYYPLRQYLNENLDVTINTDNPFISDSNLTIEYLVSAWLAGGLTKWEVLRLIKNSFRSTSIPKEQKRLLMNEIDDEIYILLMNEGDL